MNQKTVKFLRKISKKMGFTYKSVKHGFEQLGKEQQAQFVRKWKQEVQV